MKIHLFIVPLYAILLLSMAARAQDTLIYHNGDEQVVKVLLIDSKQIKYKKASLPGGPVFSESKDKIFMVKYESGRREMMKSEAVTAPTPTPNAADRAVDYASWQDYFALGAQDAKKYYVSYKSAGTVSLFAGVVGLTGCGLPVPLACSITEPDLQNLGYPNATLFANESYRQGYIREAKRIKAIKVWKNYGIGASIFAVGYGCVYAIFLATLFGSI